MEPAGRGEFATMNSNANDVPFHERHDDELLTLEDVAQILKTSENTIRSGGARRAPARSSSRSAGGSTRPPTCAASFARSGSRPGRLSASRRRCESHGRPAPHLPQRE
jgi:hypothetical protein